MEPLLGDTACFHILSKAVPLAPLGFVLFCFSYRPCCQLHPEATMNIEYWAGQRLININNMHRETLSVENNPHTFLATIRLNAKWLWEIPVLDFFNIRENHSLSSNVKNPAALKRSSEVNEAAGSQHAEATGFALLPYP
jgi:hypothetical protein